MYVEVEGLIKGAGGWWRRPICHEGSCVPSQNLCLRSFKDLLTLTFICGGRVRTWRTPRRSLKTTLRCRFSSGWGRHVSAWTASRMHTLIGEDSLMFTWIKGCHVWNSNYFFNDFVLNKAFWSKCTWQEHIHMQQYIMQYMYLNVYICWIHALYNYIYVHI